MNHVMKIERDDQPSFCSDHYCTGHYDKWVTCSCGWKQTSYGSYSDNKDEVAWLMHVVTALQTASTG